MRSRSSPFPGSSRPALTRSDGHRRVAWSGNRRRPAFAKHSTLLCLHRRGPRNFRRSRGDRSSEGSRPACLQLEGLRPRLRGSRRRLRGNDRRGGRNHRRRLLAGRRRSARRNLGVGQEQERIQVAVRLGAPPHAEIDVGHRQLHHATGTYGADEIALPHRRPASHGDRAQMQERDRVPVLRLERDRPAPHRDGPGEGDHPGRRGQHGCARWSADVDPAMLASRIRIVAEQEGSQHRALHRPGPTQSGRGQGERSRDHNADEQSDRHRAPPPLSDMETTAKVAEPGDRCQI